MGYASKSKGYRNITVEGVRYRWRFDSDNENSTVTLQGSESGGQQAIVTLRGLRDPWLAFADGTARFVVVSPKMVRRMVCQALAAGWQPQRRGAPVRFDFHANENVG